MAALLKRTPPDRPDAILALSDVLAVGARYALNQHGVRVPDDVALVGYDDLPFAAFMTPPLTRVRLPYEEMGRAAIAWLVEAVRGRVDAPLQRVYEPGLVIRESSPILTRGEAGLQGAEPPRYTCIRIVLHRQH